MTEFNGNKENKPASLQQHKENKDRQKKAQKWEELWAQNPDPSYVVRDMEPPLSLMGQDELDIFFESYPGVPKLRDLWFDSQTDYETFDEDAFRQGIISLSDQCFRDKVRQAVLDSHARHAVYRKYVDNTSGKLSDEISCRLNFLKLGVKRDGIQQAFEESRKIEETERVRNIVEAFFDWDKNTINPDGKQCLEEMGLSEKEIQHFVDEFRM